VPVHHHIQYAGFLRRAGAFGIDMLIVSLASSAFIAALFGADALNPSSQQPGSTALPDWRILLIEHVLPALWFIGFWLLWMATPGKLLFDCHIADARSLGRPRPVQLLLRYLGYLLSSLPLGLGFLWILVDRRRQGWHDKLSRTVVIMQDDSRLELEALS
jgi:uncharacterized RDD family membrane protein YckC